VVETLSTMSQWGQIGLPGPAFGVLAMLVEPQWRCSKVPRTNDFFIRELSPQTTLFGELATLILQKVDKNMDGTVKVS